MDELANTIGYLVITAGAVVLFIYVLTAIITSIVHIVSFVGRLGRRKPHNTNS